MKDYQFSQIRAYFAFILSTMAFNSGGSLAHFLLGSLWGLLGIGFMVGSMFQLMRK